LRIKQRIWVVVQIVCFLILRAPLENGRNFGLPSPTAVNYPKKQQKMFKKFSAEENVSSTSQVKNSVQRAIISQIVTQYPLLENAIETILPKKSMLIGKGSDGIQLIIVNNEVIFFNHRDGPYFPTLRLLHKYPTMVPRMQVDKGAIRFVLGGANIMCPGFTSKGGAIPQPVGKDQPVAIYAEGKQHALAIGITKMSTGEIISINKGIGVDNVHYLMDGLWQTQQLE
jgi:PUA domain protein